MMAKRLAVLLNPWIKRAEELRDHFLWALTTRNRQVVDKASQWYLQSARDLHDTSREFLGLILSGHGRNPRGYVPMEIFERQFVKLREQAELAISAYGKARRGGGKAARSAKKAADYFIAATRNYARELEREMKLRGIWTEKLGREMGIHQWLQGE